MARQTVRQIAELLEKIDTAMLTTVGPDGFLVSRPLSTQDSAFDGKRVWFFTEADSPKVAEIERNPKVNLAYASKDHNTYISLAGTASVNRDRRRIGRLWNDAMKAFFPNGKDDPNLVLLEVQTHSIEYWDGPGSLIGKLVSFVVARVTRDEEVMGKNRLVDMTGKRSTSMLPPSHKDAPAGARKAARQVLKKPAPQATATARAPAASRPTGKAAKTAGSTRKATKGASAARESAATKTTTKAASGRATARKAASRKPASKKVATRTPATKKPAAKKAPTRSTAGARAESIRRARTRGR